LGEHLICIQGVAGSTPVISTSFLATGFEELCTLNRFAMCGSVAVETQAFFLKEGFVFDSSFVERLDI
jgi:hypothetical protein